MTRRDEGESTFDYEGQTWRLRFDFNAMVDFEELTGKRMQGVLDEMSEGIQTAKDTRALFWAMLQKYHRGIAPESAGEMLLAGMGALMAAAESAMPGQDPDTTAMDDQPEKTLAAPNPAA